MFVMTNTQAMRASKARGCDDASAGTVLLWHHHPHAPTRGTTDRKHRNRQLQAPPNTTLRKRASRILPSTQRHLSPPSFSRTACDTANCQLLQSTPTAGLASPDEADDVLSRLHNCTHHTASGFIGSRMGQSLAGTVRHTSPHLPNRNCSPKRATSCSRYCSYETAFCARHPRVLVPSLVPFTRPLLLLFEA